MLGIFFFISSVSSHYCINAQDTTINTPTPTPDKSSEKSTFSIGNTPRVALFKKNSHYLLDKQVNGQFGYLVDSEHKTPLSVDFALLHSLSVTYSDNPLIWGLGVSGDEKIINTLPNYNNNFKVGARFVIPGSSRDFLNRWGIDTWIFYKMAVKKDNLFGWTTIPFSKKEDELSGLNMKDGVGAEVSFFSEPYYLNIYFSSSTKKYNDPLIMDKDNNLAYFTFTDFKVSTSFFWSLYELHRLKFDFGVGGYDVYYAAYDNQGAVTRSGKESNLLMLPYAELQYTMETELKSNQLFGCGVRFFDGHLKGNLWLQLIKESSFFPVNIRVESHFVTNRVIGKDRSWEFNEKSIFHVQLRARYGFNMLNI